MNHLSLTCFPRNKTRKRILRVVPFVIASFFVMLLFMTHPVDAITEEWSSYYELGVEFYEDGEFVMSIENIEAALALNPETGMYSVGGAVVNYYPHWYLCESYLELEEDAAAECHCIAADGDGDYESCVNEMAGSTAVEEEIPDDEPHEDSSDPGDSDDSASDIDSRNADRPDTGLSSTADDEESGMELIVPDFSDRERAADSETGGAASDEANTGEEDADESFIRKRRKPSYMQDTEEAESDPVKDEMAARIADMRRRAPQNAANPEGEDLDADEKKRKKIVEDIVTAGIVVLIEEKLKKDSSGDNHKQAPPATGKREKDAPEEIDILDDPTQLKPRIKFLVGEYPRFKMEDLTDATINIPYSVINGSGRQIIKIENVLEGTKLHSIFKTVEVIACTGYCMENQAFTREVGDGTYRFTVRAEDNVGAVTQKSIEFVVDKP